MKRPVNLLIFVLLLLVPITAWASGASQDTVRAVYFYLPLCEACLEAEEAVNNFRDILREQAPNVTLSVQTYNAELPREQRLLAAYYRRYSVPENQQAVPVLFIGDRVLSDSDIREGLKQEAGRIARGEMPPTLEIGLDEAENSPIKHITALSVAAYGLIAGFNPCSLSMLLLLLSLLLDKRGRMLTVALSFAAAKYVMYLLLGSVFYAVIARISGGTYARVVNIVLGLLALCLAGFYLRDVVIARREQYGRISMQLPRGLRRINQRLIERHALRGAAPILTGLMLGALVSVGEFLCTGQMYLASIVSVVQLGGAGASGGFGYLLIYTTAFSVPLLAVIGVLAVTGRALALSEWARRRMPVIKLVTAIAFILFGLYNLFFY